MKKSFDWFIYFIIFLLPIISILYIFDVLAMHHIFGLVPYMATFIITVLCLIKKINYKLKDSIIIVLLVLSVISVPVSSILCAVKPYSLSTRKIENGVEITGYRINWINDYEKDFSIEIPAIMKKQPVKSIGNKAFVGCQKFEHLIIPNGVEIIKKGSFLGAKYSKLTLPATLKKIESEAFCGYRREKDLLDFIILPKELDYIGEDSFRDIAKTIIVPKENNCSNWERNWFFGVHDTIVHYDVINTEIINDVLYILHNDHTASVASICGENEIELIEKIDFNNNEYIVTTIEAKAGYYSNFERITIPRTIYTIKKFAFAYNYNLKEIFIPNNVFIVESNIFYRCINVNIRVEHVHIPDGWDRSWNFTG